MTSKVKERPLGGWAYGQSAFQIKLTTSNFTNLPRPPQQTRLDLVTQDALRRARVYF